MTDLLDDELVSVFDRAHHAPQWAVPVWPDPVDRVRRASAHARARTLVAATVGLALVGGGAFAAVRALPSGQDRVLTPADGGSSSAQSGARWLLSPDDFDRYTAAHPSPSPAPDLVPSPAPPDAELGQLRSDIAAALPPGANTVRADAADGGTRGHATVWLRLADGTPVAVERYRLDYPLELGGPQETDAKGEPLTVTEHFTDPATWSDGTAYTVLTGNMLGYGFAADTQWSGPIAWTATPDGWFTMWTAPVSQDTLLGWARDGDADFAGG